MQGVRMVLRASNFREKAWEESSMPHTKQTSKRKHRKEAVPVVVVVGVSLSLAGGASAATAVPTADTPPPSAPAAQIILSEEEISDVSLGTFYVFDKENAATPGVQYARGCGGCRGCARGCGGCGCGGCGCGGCGCCWIWGVCRVC